MCMSMQEKGNETDLIEGLIAPAQQVFFLRSINTILTQQNEDRVTMMLKTNSTHSFPFSSTSTDCFSSNDEQQVIISCMQNFFLNVEKME